MGKNTNKNTTSYYITSKNLPLDEPAYDSSMHAHTI